MQNDKTSTVDACIHGVSEITNAEYHDPAMGISKSRLDKIHHSPLHYWVACINREHDPKEPTPVLILGSATHCAILEPDLFLLDYTCMPEGSKRTTKEGKAQDEEFLLEAAARTILKADEFNTCMRMRDFVMRHPTACHLLNQEIAEQSYFWDDLITGERCKIRPDWPPLRTNIEEASAQTQHFHKEAALFSEL